MICYANKEWAHKKVTYIKTIKHCENGLSLFNICKMTTIKVGKNHTHEKNVKAYSSKK